MKVRAPFPLVAIVWDDASTDHGWQHVDEDDTARNLVLTVGFLTREDDHYIYLASTCDEQRNTNSRIKIPRGMVSTRTEVATPRRGNAKRRSSNAEQTDDGPGTTPSP